MDYTLENEYLKVTITTFGAQVKSVRRKCDGVEHMWQADKAVWGYHAPILFPHCGKVVDGVIEAKGETFKSAQHGFARLLEHSYVDSNADSLVLELCADEKTRKVFPYEFRLVSIFTLEGSTLHHTLSVENLDDSALPFGIGYHPAFAIPFDDKHSFEDYELRFSDTESPLCVNCQPHGLLHGNLYYLGSNIRAIPIDDKLFANDSHCMLNLRSQTLGIYEKDTGRAVVCDISQFPYTLIWSKPGTPKFVCIEPWHSLPSAENGSTDWNRKPAAANLAPGEEWSCTRSTDVAR